MGEGKVNYIVGCSGFVLPKEIYFNRFRAVEVKEFYLSLIKEGRAKKWRENSPERFVFSLVAPKWIVEPLEEGEKGTTFLKGDRKGYGDFKLSEENLMLYNWIYNIAKILRSPTILFITSARWGPDKRNIVQMERFFSEIRREGVEIIWEPRGIWAKSELEGISRDLHISIAFDPVREGPKVYRSPYYARVTPLSSFSNRLSFGQWERLCSHLKLIEEGEVYIYFGNQSGVMDAERLMGLIGGTEQE